MVNYPSSTGDLTWVKQNMQAVPLAQNLPQSYPLNNLCQNYSGVVQQLIAQQQQQWWQTQQWLAMQQSLAQPSTIPYVPPEPLPDAGIQVGEIVGWRIWRIKDGFLHSYTMAQAWYPEEPMTGKAKDHNHEGVWCFKSSHDALNLATGIDPCAIGTVYLWGTVIEHSLGYRAEYAKIRSLDNVVGIETPFAESRVMRRLRAKYYVGSHKTIKDE